MENLRVLLITNKAREPCQGLGAKPNHSAALLPIRHRIQAAKQPG